MISQHKWLIKSLRTICFTSLTTPSSVLMYFFWKGTCVGGVGGTVHFWCRLDKGLVFIITSCLFSFFFSFYLEKQLSMLAACKQQAWIIVKKNIKTLSSSTFCLSMSMSASPVSLGRCCVYIVRLVFKQRGMFVGRKAIALSCYVALTYVWDYGLRGAPCWALSSCAHMIAFNVTWSCSKVYYFNHIWQCDTRT